MINYLITELIASVGFWFAVAYITKERKGFIGVLIIQFIAFGVGVYHDLNIEDNGLYV